MLFRLCRDFVQVALYFFVEIVSKGGDNVAFRAIAQELRLRAYTHRVLRTLDSGVLPLVLRYDQINSCETMVPVAYRTQTVIRSTALGYLTHHEYNEVCESYEVGFRMAEWNVREAMKHITHFVESGRNIDWISVRCPSGMVEKVDFYKWMKKLIKETHFRYPTKLCLEFGTSLLKRRTDAARLAVLDMKLLGVKTMLTGCADDSCYMSRIVDIPVDLVMLTPDATKWTGSRNKPQLVPTLVSYLRSMRTEVYAEGVFNDEQVRLLNRFECAGYTTAPSYVGENPTSRNLGVRKALAQRNTEDSFEI